MDLWSTCLYGKAGLSTGDLGSPAMSTVLALVEHVEPMGLKGLEGCSSSDRGSAPYLVHSRWVVILFGCHSLWSSLVYRCHYNLNQIILNNIEAKVRVR